MTFVEIIDDDNLVQDSTKNMLLELLESAAKHENVNTDITEMSLSFVNKEEIQEMCDEVIGNNNDFSVIKYVEDYYEKIK